MHANVLGVQCTGRGWGRSIVNIDAQSILSMDSVWHNNTCIAVDEKRTKEAVSWFPRIGDRCQCHGEVTKLKLLVKRYTSARSSWARHWTVPISKSARLTSLSPRYRATASGTAAATEQVRLRASSNAAHAFAKFGDFVLLRNSKISKIII